MRHRSCSSSIPCLREISCRTGSMEAPHVDSDRCISSRARGSTMTAARPLCDLLHAPRDLSNGGAAAASLRLLRVGLFSGGRTPTPRWPVVGLRSGNELKAGHGEPTEPGQRVIAVALVDVHHLIDLADDEDVASQGVVDAAYKDRHGSPRVVGATIHIAA